MAEQLGLDGSVIGHEVEQAFVEDSHLEDIDQVRAMGVSSYPTLLLEKDGRWYDLRSGAMTVEELERNFQMILTR